VNSFPVSFQGCASDGKDNGSVLLEFGCKPWLSLPI
jgi:hypothetical protein